MPAASAMENSPSRGAERDLEGQARIPRRRSSPCRQRLSQAWVSYHVGRETGLEARRSGGCVQHLAEIDHTKL